MLFNSHEFIFLFLPISFFLYFYLNKKQLTEAAKCSLVFSSLFFYSWWSLYYLPLILGSIVFNYALGKSLAKPSKQAAVNKKPLLIIGIIANLLLLGFFKYSDFFIENVNLAINSNLTLLDLVLPLAISFFTFQQIAYLVDSYRGETHEYNFLNYVVFVSFFPQLIAGPIVHHKEMMPQFSNAKNRCINYKHIGIGLFIFSIGLFKKVVIADTFAQWATNGFDHMTVLSLFEAWATSLSYTFQLYFDFSGYADMAIGAALLFNIKLPLNFNSPYQAVSIQDFWRRWHMTLSRFLKDYVYIPLGGNRHGRFSTYRNLMATFILGGLWHGAGWTFIFWGALHGSALVINHLWAKIGFRLNTLLAWFLTFNFINIAWVFFRAEEWADAIKVLKGMFGFNGMVISNKFIYIYESTLKDLSFLMPDIMLGTKQPLSLGFETYFWIVLAFYIVTRLPNTQEIMHYPLMAKTRVLTTQNAIKYSLVMLVGILTISLSTSSEFIYFNF